jgi:hypothetical protein
MAGRGVRNDRDLLDKHFAESSALGYDRVAPAK